MQNTVLTRDFKGFFEKSLNVILWLDPILNRRIAYRTVELRAPSHTNNKTSADNLDMRDVTNVAV
jgi:hypothetical protein